MGALESNAGDDFHFWWAAGRALGLIRPGTVSRLLAVEGLPRIDDPDDQYEFVDVTEYVGGVTSADATAVLVSQLKYSTRHPTRQWTAAQICRKRSRRGSGGNPGRHRSVVADLAGTYRQLVEQFGRDATLGKVRIRLVSNQPADPELTGAVGRSRALHGNSAVLLLACLPLAVGSRGPVALVALLLLGIQYGALSALVPAATADLVPRERFGTAYGLVFTGWGLAGLLASVVAAAGAAHIGYPGVYRYFLAVTVLSWACVAAYSRWPRSSYRAGEPDGSTSST